MERHAGAIVAFLFVLELHRVLSSTNITDITEDADELILNEGDTLELECYGSENITFVYPTNSSKDQIITSIAYIKKEKLQDTYRHLFQRFDTQPGDTGLYGCPNGTLLTKNLLEHSSWLYVYVQSNTSMFVPADTFVSLRERVGGTAVIPCRSTSPNIIVHLLFDDLEKEAPFNPRIGFILRNLTLRNSGYYQCVVQEDNMYDSVNYHLMVFRNQSLNEPQILDDNLRHVTRGKPLTVICKTEVDADLQYVFSWQIPQQNPFQVYTNTTNLTSRITAQNSRTKVGAIQYAISKLIINDVRDEDEGWYECSITSFYDSKKTKKFIKVHDPENKFINLTAQDTDKHYQRREGDKVQWVVDVNAYPAPTLKWLNNKGKEIVASWDSVEKVKYAIKSTATTSILRINHLNIDDMGEYSLQASNSDRIEMLNFTLDVLVKPVPMLWVQPYYAPNQEARIVCDVATFPSPTITWNLKKCPHFPSPMDAQNIELTGTQRSGMTTRFNSTVMVTIEASGYITCTACNIMGCESQTETILVSDVENGFGIIEPTEPVTEGDNFELICAASIYNYTNKFEWKYANDTPVEENDRLMIYEKQTPFTFRSVLRIENITKSYSTNYTCINKEQMDYALWVHEPKAPLWKESNMQKTEKVIDFNTQSNQTIILKCFVSGMPKPIVRWYKDDKPINKTDQYYTIHDHQEMHITYLRKTDNGKFSCIARNRVGTLESYVIITVKEKELPKELIILIFILLIVIIIIVIYFTIKVRREKIMRKELMEAGLMHFEEGAVECLNPDMTVDDQAELLPYDKKWEFPREKLKLGKKLGSGAFGVVMKAEAQGICENELLTTVAVKMVRRTTDPTYVRALASELKIMVHLGRHLNVVNLLGACTKNISKRELLVIVEYCRFGNLHNYLLRHRSDFINQIDPTTRKFDPSIGIDILTRSLSISSNNRIKYAALSFSRSLSGTNSAGTDSVHYQATAVDSQGVSMSPDGCVLSNNSVQPGWRSNYRGDYKDHNLKPICTQDLLSWAFQVARGMEYLSQRKVLHGDLAARNILLSEDNVVKICDFGLAKTIYKDNNYKKKGDGPLPIKWMAIESIRDRIFSTQSDIWSFGIVLWEFFTLAETPYPGMEAEKQYQKLIEGYRMERPEYATSEVYDIMLQCWKAKPTLRPSFTELVKSIGVLLEESVRAHYISLNDPYIDMNTTMLEDGRSDYLTMLSAPDHTTLSSPTHEYSNMPVSSPPDSAYLCMSPSNHRDESGIFSPRPEVEQTHFEFPSPTSDSEDAVEISPMLKKEDDDPYLKPINVQKRRAEFVQQRLAMKDQPLNRPIDRDSGYCNTPRNLQLIDLNERNERNSKTIDEKEKPSNESSVLKDFLPAIIRTQDNYVNMPKQKNDLRLDVPDGFSNPSYVFMVNREMDQTKV
ncbi:Vascular endothelial growth factor receptor 1 [Anthophora plagiata]